MTNPPDAEHHSLHMTVAVAARDRPLERKLLICRRRGEGRELLRALTLHGTNWVGFEATTPHSAAQEYASLELARAGARLIDEFDEAALVDGAMDGAISEGRASPLEPLRDGIGLRRELAGTLRALRLAGASPEDIRSAGLRDRAKAEALAAVLARYEANLGAPTEGGGSLVDAADVFRIAERSVRANGLSAATYLVPGLAGGGLPGRFLRALLDAGATLLDHEPIVEAEKPRTWLGGGSATAPAGPQTSAVVLSGLLGRYLFAPHRLPEGVEVEATLFAAGSIRDEVREALRRVTKTGLAWDEVEIVATDPVAYGVALDVIARPLDIPVTYAVGLPFERTRPGRVVHAYLEWLREDFPADVIRTLIERDDLRPRVPAEVTGGFMARVLRRLRIGRGRGRYLAALDEALTAQAGRSPVGAAAVARVELERAALVGLVALFESVITATPELPDRLRTRAVPVQPAHLAQGLLAVLGFVPVGDGVDETATRRLTERLERIQATATRAVGLDSAIAMLLSKLETRVPAPDAQGPAPWSSAGGHLHLTDVLHGGLTGRRVTYVVGLDAGRFPGALNEASLLNDDDRARLVGQGFDGLPSSSDLQAERRYRLATLLARTRGVVTLSYAAWDPALVRGAQPAPELLQAHRVIARRPLASYEEMRAAMGRLASPVPRAARLDGTDAWIGHLLGGPVPVRAVDLVRDVFRGLDHGLVAEAERQALRFTPFDGRVRARAGLDPRSPDGDVVSARRLETLGACPLRYLMQYVLRLHAPDDLTLEPDRWLSPLDRGLLLHRVFEQALRRAKSQQVDFEDSGFESLALQALDYQVSRWRSRVPPPGTAVFEREVSALRTDTQAFVRMTRASEGHWIDLERSFGRRGDPPAVVTLPSGELRVMGAIDRIDELPSGDLVVIDYKTGLPFGFNRSNGTYWGGRRLQHVVYGAVAESQLGRPVARAEYHFPSVRGQNQRYAFPARELQGGLEVVDHLLDIAARGHFHATFDADDCKLCDFRPVCRVSGEGAGTPHSPPAQRAERARTEVAELAALAALRDAEAGKPDA